MPASSRRPAPAVDKFEEAPCAPPVAPCWTGTVPEAGTRLVYILHNEAKKRGAHCLATVCPLCQFNLDAYHAQVRAEYGDVLTPAVYFTQLMGLAFGLPEEKLGLNRAAIPFLWRPAQPGPAQKAVPCSGYGPCGGPGFWLKADPETAQPEGPVRAPRGNLCIDSEGKYWRTFKPMSCD